MENLRERKVPIYVADSNDCDAYRRLRERNTVNGAYTSTLAPKACAADMPHAAASR